MASLQRVTLSSDPYRLTVPEGATLVLPATLYYGRPPFRSSALVDVTGWTSVLRLVDSDDDVTEADSTDDPVAYDAAKVYIGDTDGSLTAVLPVAVTTALAGLHGTFVWRATTTEGRTIELLFGTWIGRDRP